jgi:hypothetical protein
MAQVYGAGGKTVPKKGRLGTGSYYPGLGTPLYQHQGNIFPGINVEQFDSHQLTFGDPSRAGIATVVGQNRVQSEPLHPNKQHYNIITEPLIPAMIVSSSNERNNLQPVSPKSASLSMPHERNTNSASGTKKKPNPYRTAFGASSTMASDTAFHKDPGANYKHSVRQKPNSAVEAVKRKSTVGRTFGIDNFDHSPSAVDSPTKQRRTPPPSFASHGNIWYDPNNSFIAGQDGGVGRWSMVKRGVV